MSHDRLYIHIIIIKQFYYQIFILTLALLDVGVIS